MKDKHKFLERVTQATPDIIYLYDLRHQRYIYINRELENLLGYSTKDIEKAGAKLFLGRIHPDDLPKVTDHIQTLASTRSDSFFELELRIKGKDGSYLWVFVRENVLLRNTDNQPEILFGICQDISERKRLELILSDKVRVQKPAEKKLSMTTEQFSDAFYMSPAVLAITRLSDGKFIEANKSFLDVFEFNREEVIGHTSTELKLWSPENRKKLLSIQLQSGGLPNTELEVKSKSGRIVNIVFSSRPMEVEGEICLITTMIDITGQKKADEALKKSQALLLESMEKIRIITKNTPDHILVQDKDLRYTLVINPQLGFKESDMIGKTDYDLVSKPEAAKINLIKTRVIETGKPENIGAYLSARDGKSEYLEGTYVPNIDDKGNVQGLIGYFRNVTERKLAEEEIRKSREQIEQLYRHVNKIREEERTNISREIHDELGQSLAGLKIDLINMKENLDVLLQEKLNRAISLLDKTIKSVRKISSDLRPEMLDDLGLAPAIEWQTNEFKKRTGIKCKLDLEEIEELNADVSISLFRIFQAALTNIMLHSKAKSVSIKMSLKEEMVILAVIDNGRGITPAQINSPKSFGIMGMRERTNQINGKFEIHAGKNKGTEIIVSVPLKKQ